MLGPPLDCVLFRADEALGAGLPRLPLEAGELLARESAMVRELGGAAPVQSPHEQVGQEGFGMPQGAEGEERPTVLGGQGHPLSARKGAKGCDREVHPEHGAAGTVARPPGQDLLPGGPAAPGHHQG